MYRKISAILIVLIHTVALFGQVDTTSMIKYSPDFIFNEGIFLNFNQVRTNNPIPKTRILSKDNIDDFDFFTNLIEEEMIYYYDNVGLRKEVRTDNIWGFSRNGALFINYNGTLNRIPVVGSICHFVSNVTVVTERYDPYYDPFYYDRYSYGNYYNPYNYRSYPSRTSKNEMRQYLLDFSTGEIIAYDRKSVEILLMKDSEIYDEYQALKRKKKKQLKFYYLRKYNEKHPLYFPPGKINRLY